jgi:hypothetical protein
MNPLPEEYMVLVAAPRICHFLVCSLERDPVLGQRPKKKYLRRESKTVRLISLTEIPFGVC